MQVSPPGSAWNRAGVSGGIEIQSPSFKVNVSPPAIDAPRYSPGIGRPLSLSISRFSISPPATTRPVPPMTTMNCA